MSIYIHKSHNVSVLLYHIVCPAKYREIVLSNEVDNAIKKICIEISKRYEMHFVEIGADKDHVHFLVQSVPTYSPTKIVRTIKSITAREIFRQIPSIKKELWGGEFWTDGYYINTVSKRGNEDVVRQYVKKQGNEGDYEQLHFVQLKLI
ncbi:MAG: IS200/IS605 family transposase [Desulfobacterales bacterium]|jgi:putative transposase